MAFSYETDFIHHGGRKHSLCSNSMSYISQDESGCPGKQTGVKGMEQMLACEGKANSNLVVPGMAWSLTLKCHRRQLRTTLELTAAWPLTNLTLVSRRCCHFSRTRWINSTIFLIIFVAPGVGVITIVLFLSSWPCKTERWKMPYRQTEKNKEEES